MADKSSASERITALRVGAASTGPVAVGTQTGTQPEPRVRSSWQPQISAGRKVVAGASVVSFAAMVVAMGPLSNAADGVSSTAEGEGAGQPAPDPDYLVPATPAVQFELNVLPTPSASMAAPRLPAGSETATQSSPANPTAAPAPSTTVVATTQTTPPRSKASG